MPSDLVRLAESRVRHDLERTVFYRHPYELRFIQRAGADAWMARIEAEVDAADYAGAPSPSLEVPKENWHVRPGLILSIDDQLAYHYLGLQAAEHVAPRIEWSAYTVRFSYRLSPRRQKHWFEHVFTGWKNFDRVSLAKLSAGATHVLVSDISGYYENIDVGRLVRELRAIDVSDGVCRQLSALWNKWAGVRGRGIPQAFSPSHVFGEFYLDPIDRSLRADGLEHVRYMDDIRIFTKSRLSARKALREYVRLLRERGLNPQTGKTEILSAEEARARFGMVPESLGALSRTMAKELEILGKLGEYVDPNDLREYLEFDPDDPKPQVVERAWRSFADGDLGDFNKTLFHYLIARLADQNSAEAAEYCDDAIRERPEETHNVLRYLARVREHVPDEAIHSLAVYIDSDEIIYDYQRYLILRWFQEQGLGHTHALEAAKRVVVTAQPRLMRPHAIAYIGDHVAEAEDFRRLERGLQEETSRLERATFLYALRRAPAPTRDHWYGRCAGETVLVDAAIACGRSDAA